MDRFPSERVSVFPADDSYCRYHLEEQIFQFGHRLNPDPQGLAAVTGETGVKTTLYFGARSPLGSNTNSFQEDLQTLFMTFFTLTGQYSDSTLYGQTIPYPVGNVTDSIVSTSITTGATRASVTVTGNGFNPNARAFIGWIDSKKGKITSLTKFTTDGSGNLPSGTTITVPSASAGSFTIIVSDYVDTIFSTFLRT